MQTNNTQRIKKITALAVFAALAYVLHFIHIPVGFLNLDFKDVVTTIAGMYFGPLSGLCLSVLVPLLEYPTSATREYGLIMNILSSASFVCVASLVYKFKKTLSGAITGLVSAIFSMVAVMMIANLIITPFYMGVSRSAVIELIPKMLLPFNAIKATLNASLTLCFYKPFTRILKKTGFGRSEGDAQGVKQAGNKKTTAIVLGIGLVISAISLVIIFTVLGGTLQFS